MKRMLSAVMVGALFASVALCGEGRVRSTVSRVAMFKNGLAVVTRTAELPGPGAYELDDLPEPVHGTFWIESPAPIAARVTTRTVEVEPAAPGAVDLQDELGGREVTIHFQGENIPPVSGRVLAHEPPAGAEAWDRTYHRTPYGYGARGLHSNRSGGFLLLETGTGRTYVRTGLIASVRVKDAGETVAVTRPVLVLEAGGEEGGAVPVTIQYLAKGLTWAPSYRVDIANPEILTVTQKAVIRNEFAPLREAPMFLISGFPSIEFAHVNSPLSPRTTLANFFKQLNREPGRNRGHRVVVTQQRAVAHNRAAPDAPLDLSALASGQGPDIHYQPIGTRSLKEGDTLALEVARGQARYERLVEWIVPDTRTANGRHIPRHERERNPQAYRDAAWDAIRFENPLPFPMTTGPAMIVGDAAFHGQRTSYWVNRGERATLHITKALSIRTRSVEHEEEGEREIVHVGGDDFRRTTVKGELTLNNHRDESVTVLIRRRFSGELLSADGEPTTSLREEGVWSVNKRNELAWTITLAAGAERSLSYRYEVLVDR